MDCDLKFLTINLFDSGNEVFVLPPDLFCLA